MVLLAATGATIRGGGSSIGSVGNFYKVGIGVAVIVCAWHLQLMFTGLFVAPRLRGLELIMVADYFDLKFGRLARAGLFLLLSDPIVILILGLSA